MSSLAINSKARYWNSCQSAYKLFQEMALIYPQLLQGRKHGQNLSVQILYFNLLETRLAMLARSDVRCHTYSCCRLNHSIKDVIFLPLIVRGICSST